ncbi:MOSC domain-containing protein [Mycobacterium sp. MMS18-G62]
MTASVAALWRYSVKSMAGEQVSELVLGPGSVVGDRAYGFVEADTGRLVSAKRYAALLECCARSTTNGVEVTFPDGSVISDSDELSQRASALLGRDVRFVRYTDNEAQSVLAAAAPETLADFAPVHLLAVSALHQVAAEHPDGVWDARRFRPNVLIDDAGEGDGTEGWLGCDVHLGAQVVVHAVIATPRCVMTTHAQGELPRDRAILRTLARSRRRDAGPFGESAAIGSYADVVTPGVVRRGDRVRVERVEPRRGVLAAALQALNDGRANPPPRQSRRDSDPPPSEGPS